MRRRSHRLWVLLAAALAGCLLIGLAGTATAPSSLHGPQMVVRAADTGVYVVRAGDAPLLRRAPRLSAPVIETLAVGTKLRVRGYHTSWMEVTAPDGAMGYLLDPGVAHVPQTAARLRLLPAAAWAAADGGYPRLANYNGLRYSWQVPFLTPDSLVIARRNAPLGQLTRSAPGALTLLYERTLQADLCCMQQLYGLRTVDVPPVWWLTLAGSRLARPIDAHQQWIPVADARPFARCQDVLVDGESMHVWDVRGHLLHVWRGYYSRATRHAAGALIAPHYSYRKDLSNCHLFGRAYSVRPWSFNLSSRCPRWHGMTWADYLAQRVAYLVRRDGWRGVFYDNMDDVPRTDLVDVNRDGRADGGIIGGVNVWRQGEQALLAETRRLLPNVPLMVNGDLVLRGLADGREMESFPLIPGLALSAAIDRYLYDSDAGARLTIVNPDSNAHHSPTPLAAKVAVSVGLLGNGYTAYDFGWLDHGYPWWFDAFDGGAGSAILRPVTARATLLPVAHPRRFRSGDVVLLDQEAARVLRVLARGLVVRRGYWHTVPVWHRARTAVTTPAQRAAGRGYLGQPLGAARVIATANWTRYLQPVWLAGGASGDLAQPKPSRASVGAHLLAPDALLRLSSSGHYDPAAVRLTLLAPAMPGVLRTLVFTARGPDGEGLWLYADRASARLVLRRSWHRYVLPVGWAGRFVFGAGRVRGDVLLKDVRLVGVQAFVLRRDFTRGTVIVNPTDVSQRVLLGRAYRVLAGDQDPWADNGRLTCAISIARYRAAILLDTSARLRCARPAGAARAAGAAVYVVTTRAGVNLRRGPRLAAPVIERLPLGTQLRVLGYHTSWVAVMAPDGRSGYVFGGYVRRAGTQMVPARPLAAPATARPTTAAYVVTAVRRLALRRGPRLDTPVIEWLPLGTRLRVLGYHVSWMAVIAPDGASGYVLRRFLRNEGPPSRAGQRTGAQPPRAPAAAPGFRPPFLIVGVAAANLRAAPSVGSRIVGVAPRGTRLALHALYGGWAEVETATGRTGWIWRALTRPLTGAA